MKPNFFIKFKTLSPLFQIEDKGKMNKLKFLIDDNGEKALVEIPYFTENAVKGILRRLCSELVYMEAQKKGISICAEDFHLAYAGGGLNVDENASLDMKKKISELNKVLSLLGTGLVLRSKIAVSGLVPEVVNNDRQMSWQTRRVEPKSGEPFYVSRLTQERTYYKKDDIIDETDFMRVLSDDTVKAWMQSNEEENKNRKADIVCPNPKCGKKYSPDKLPKGNKCSCETILDSVITKKTGVSNIFTKEYIIPGVTLVGSITAKEDLDEVECGLLLLSLEKLANRSIGASTAMGFGVGDWSIYNDTDKITDDEEKEKKTAIIYSQTNKNFFLKPKGMFKNYSEEELSCIDKAKEWIDNITEENIHIFKLIKKVNTKKEKE